jgi:cystathionine gamma-synthase
VRSAGGAVLGPLEAWLLLRGMRTLHVRVAAACDNAWAIARRFEGHPKLSHVLYPGLPSHPGHVVASRQMSGRYGAMLSLRCGRGEAAARAFTANLRVFKRANNRRARSKASRSIAASVGGPGTDVPRGPRAPVGSAIEQSTI